MKIYEFFSILNNKYIWNRIMGFNPFEIFSDIRIFKQDDPNDKTEELMQEDVMDEDTLDDWTLDDFFTALPKTIKTNYDVICSFHLWYTKDNNRWNSSYDTPWGEHQLETSNISKYECLKELYFKVKSL